MPRDRNRRWLEGGRSGDSETRADPGAEPVNRGPLDGPMDSHLPGGSEPETSSPQFPSTRRQRSAFGHHWRHPRSRRGFLNRKPQLAQVLSGSSLKNSTRVPKRGQGTSKISPGPQKRVSCPGQMPISAPSGRSCIAPLPARISRGPRPGRGYGSCCPVGRTRPTPLLLSQARDCAHARLPCGYTRRAERRPPGPRGIARPRPRGPACAPALG